MSASASASGGGGNESHGGLKPWKKKKKAPRIPKRGPGVAELEKILRQQQSEEMGMHGNKANVGLFSTSWTSPHECNHHAPLPTPQTLCPSSSLTKNVTPFSTHLGILNPSQKQLRALYGNDSNRSGVGLADDGDENVGSSVSKAIIMSDGIAYPTVWSSAEPSTHKHGLKYDPSYMSCEQVSSNSHPTELFRRKQNGDPTFPISHFPNTFSSPIPPQHGRNLNVEPPSNQRSHQSLPQENAPTLTDTHHVLSTCSHVSVHDYGPRKPVPRDVNSTYCNTIKLNSKTNKVEYRDLSDNFLKLGPPVIPSPTTKFLGEDSTFSSPPHPKVEELYKSSEPREAAHKTPFYSFLQLKKPTELEGGNNKRDGTGEDFVDLSLRL